MYQNNNWVSYKLKTLQNKVRITQQKLMLLEEGCDLSPVESSCVMPYDR